MKLTISILAVAAVTAFQAAVGAAVQSGGFDWPAICITAGVAAAVSAAMNLARWRDRVQAWIDAQFDGGQ